MSISNFIINDISIQPISQKIKTLKKIFNEMSCSHLPIERNGIYIGCVSEIDIRCFEGNKPLTEYEYSLEAFFVRQHDNWLDVLGQFARNNANLLPVLEEGTPNYLGYVELNDIIGVFNETPFLNEDGGIVVIEKGFNDYSFSEISQIVESNDGKVFGAFISKLENDVAQITLKIGLSSINEVIQSFRRYGYTIVSSHQEDTFFQNLKERSDYLTKYLNI